MCYSAEVSAATAGFVGIVAWYLWKRNRRQDRPIALILLIISSMQLIEFGLWLNLDCNTSIHQFLSKSIPIALLLQPLFVSATLWAYSSAGYLPRSVYAALTGVMVLHLLYYGPKTLKEKHCVVVGKGRHLEWGSVPNSPPIPFVHRWLYNLGLVIPILSLRNTPFAVLYLVFTSLSSYAIAGVYEKSWPSVWCHFVNSLGLIAIAT